MPGRVVRINGEKTQDLIPEKDDPVLREICALRERIFELEERLDAAIAYAENGDRTPKNETKQEQKDEN